MANKFPLERLYRTFRDPSRIHPIFLRGRHENLVDVLPRFPGTDTPVIYHLPTRTITTIVETLSSPLAADVFVRNGRSAFGLDSSVVQADLPRWRVSPHPQKSQLVANSLLSQLLRKPKSIPHTILPDVIQTTAELAYRGLLTAGSVSGMASVLVPQCLENLTLSRNDVLKIVSGMSKMQITKENAVLVAMVGNFTHWFLSRHEINRKRRLIKSSAERRAIAASTIQSSIHS